MTWSRCWKSSPVFRAN